MNKMNDDDFQRALSPQWGLRSSGRGWQGNALLWAMNFGRQGNGRETAGPTGIAGFHESTWVWRIVQAG